MYITFKCSKIISAVKEISVRIFNQRSLLVQYTYYNNLFIIEFTLSKTFYVNCDTCSFTKVCALTR